jgi:kelch-like protein 20/kelch-like protein 24/35
MQEGRSGFGAAVIDGSIVVAGGEVLVAPFSVRTSVERFDPAAGSWRFEAELPMPLHGTGATAYDGRMYLFGGATMPASAEVRGGWVHVLGP